LFKNLYTKKTIYWSFFICLLKPVPSFIQIVRVVSLEKEEYIKREKGMFVFLKDCIFASPSAAAGIILQKRSNGWEVWKNEFGKTLNEIKRADLL
jgi:hypothetical protein